MYLATAHGTFVGFDGGELVQVDPDQEAGAELVELSPSVGSGLIESGPLSGFHLLRTEKGLQFRKDGLFLCADPVGSGLPADRPVADLWETFHLVDGAEKVRFRRQVEWLTGSGKPVKLYCGAGRIPRLGFLNLDRTVESPNFMAAHPDEYFIFPFADTGWGIPDNSVDYIFHEDFIEHISQLQQIQFLAETLRVLKPGCYHRVNTPNLLTSMRRHSDFKAGFAGVYTGEMEWDHIAIFTPAS